MPKCAGCGGGNDTPALIQAGDGIIVYGTGAPESPYTIEAEQSDSVLALSVRDSSTVNLTITGSGSIGDPYVLTADTGSATSLTGLADYQAASLPTAGQVVTWVGTSAGGHWTPASLPAGTAPTTNAAALTQGILSNDRLSGVMLDRLAGSVFAGDFNSLLTPGMYLTGTGTSNGPTVSGQGLLIVAAAGTTGVSQTWIAVGGETAGAFWYRGKATASGWFTWRRIATAGDLDTLLQQITQAGGTVGTQGAAISALQTAVGSLQGQAPSWNTASANAQSALTTLANSKPGWDGAVTKSQQALDAVSNAISAPVLTINAASGFVITRDGTRVRGDIVNLDIDVTANQNVGNAGDIGNVLVATLNSGFGSAGFPAVSSGRSGPVLSGYVNSTGIYLSALTQQMLTGNTFSLSGTWIRS